MVVRQLQPDEAAVYRTIRLAALAQSPEAFGSTLALEADRPLEFFAARMAAGAVFVAEIEGLVVGMVGFRQEEREKLRHKGVIWGVFVRPEARGRGVAEAIVRAARAYAREKVEQAHLVVVRGNDSAHGLYARLGFTEYGIEPRALRMGAEYFDEILMVKIFL